MGASVYAYWPDITDSQIDSQPGFYNDCKAWGDWMAERESEPGVAQALRRLHADAILTYSTDGMSDESVNWVAPSELREAVTKLRQAVEQKNPDAEIILEVYSRTAIRQEDIALEFIQDLKDIEAITEWADWQGATKMTLFVGW